VSARIPAPRPADRSGTESSGLPSGPTVAKIAIRFPLAPSVRGRKEAVLGAQALSVTRPDFEGLLTLHAAGMRTSRAIGIGLAVLGVLLVAIGIAPAWLGLVHGWPLWLGGLAVIAVAAFPTREYLEHRDRISGLEVLRDEWADLEAEGADDASKQRLREIVRSLYPTDFSG
jgi:hypothetical protein